MRRVLVLVGVPLMLLLAGCGSASDTTSTGGADATTTVPTTPPTTTPPRSVQSFPAGKGGDAMAKNGKAAGAGAKKADPSGTTTTVAGASADLKEFCKTAKAQNVTSLEAFAKFDKKGAATLVLAFAHMEKVAPADIAAAVTDMEPLVKEANEQVKQGKVTDLASFKAWLQQMNQTNPDPIKKWIAAQQLLVPYVQKNCA
jgi:hypothetical protein